ncbi:hypothetical protein [Singulisphaera acidiphila]|nr:hypothetical protein [Singulisphaera acidiphila]
MAAHFPRFRTLMVRVRRVIQAIHPPSTRYRPLLTRAVPPTVAIQAIRPPSIRYRPLLTQAVPPKRT